MYVLSNNNAKADIKQYFFHWQSIEINERKLLSLATTKIYN